MKHVGAWKATANTELHNQNMIVNTRCSFSKQIFLLGFQSLSNNRQGYSRKYLKKIKAMEDYTTSREKERQRDTVHCKTECMKHSRMEIHSSEKSTLIASTLNGFGKNESAPACIACIDVS